MYRIFGPHGHLIARRPTLKKLPALIRRFKRVSVTRDPVTPAAPVIIRRLIVAAARWGAAHEPEIHYTEGPGRDDWLAAKPPNKLPLSTDCSGFVTLCYAVAGAHDPNGLSYAALGYTGTLLQNAQHHGKILTDVSQARPGDPIVVGPGTGLHVVVCLEAGRDPLVCSHGKEAGPVIQRLSVDGREPKRVCVTLP